MPLYEYRCSDCEHLEEVLQKLSDPAPAACPSCGKEHTMVKEVSRTSFQLKGGGWYKDLYSSVPADKGKKSETASSKAGASDSSGSASSSSSAASGSTASTSTPSSSGAASSGASTSSSSTSGSSGTKGSPSSPKAA